MSPLLEVTSNNAIFKYQTAIRWSGSWENPNIAGLLMATGVVLALGMVLGHRCVPDFRQSGMVGSDFRHFLTLIALLLSVFILFHGLASSWSRGAWFGSLFGVVYMLGNFFKRLFFGEKNRTVRLLGLLFLNYDNLSPIRRQMLPALVFVISLGAISFWRYQVAECQIAKRFLSILNPIDFSWRNRVSAWEGALQISADHPWFGAGWSQPNQLYEHYYLSPRLTENGAIEMNDYLLLCSSVGIPALFCFGMYACMSLKKKVENRSWGVNVDWLGTVCRAGAIVLLVGFWFDGGLFKLATGSIFWIMLELGKGKCSENV